jgi:putative ABC transport system permease protein
MTVREAISNYGLAAQGKRSWFDRLLETVQVLPRPLLISLRNTFRKKGRLLLTLFTLVLGGATFMAVLNVQQAMYDALDITFGYILSDVNVDFGRGYRVERIQEALKGIPGIRSFEGWGFSNAQSMQLDGVTGDQVVLVAPPSTSTLIKPSMISGRWLLPEDENAIVVGNHYLKERPETMVGDILSIRMDGEDYPFTVVGIYKMAGNTIPPILYTNYEHLAGLLNQTGQIYSIRVSLDDSSFTNQKAVADLMEARFKELDMPVGSIQTGGDLIQQNRFVVDILIYMLLIMAVLIAVVGGLGLMGTMSMNVMERTREIGVMRSIGAVNSAIFQLVVTEGMIIGIISWSLGIFLCIPMTNLLNVLVGVSILTVPLDFVFALKGLLLWLAVVISLSALASILPARNAVRLTVRDVLAYE